MNKPYIICHMMMSIDGRIDCGMTAQIPGNNTYYEALDKIDAPTRISGKVTAATELTDGDLFKAQDATPIGHEAFKKNSNSNKFEIVTDTHGTLLWRNDHDAIKPHLILMSEQASQEYVDYLNKQGISWIATGKNRIDLTRAMKILADEFNIERVAIVGGGKINGGFLQAGLIDEVSLVMGPAVDGRINQPGLFDGRTENEKPVKLKLETVQKFDDGSLWLRYLV
ncbi:dihydrofolate reductase family protein [Lactobacillus sp. PSON]|uniref:dihydrofolate reductase family protein n=1 Tax=Lactobacillus sp. PSON TaxID=3455454 RepID=UPI004042F647